MINKHCFNILLLVNSLLIICLTSSFDNREEVKQDNPNKWFPVYDLDPVTFQYPPQEFGPFARWWWPGNDVLPDELRREINLFADNAFAGVEIQPITMNLPLSPGDRRNKILSWDTPEFYRNVRTVMDEAQKRKLIIDMNNGSGWPAGGAHLNPEDGFINLLYASEAITGGKKISMPVPTIYEEEDITPKLQVVMAVRKMNQDEDAETILLDASFTTIITEYVKNDSLYWSAPDGNWEIIAFWSRPNSKTGSMTAALKQGPVLNHFDSVKVFKNYQHLFGERTSLEKYYGNPLRAVFDDSYEFTVDRHFSDDFIAYFREKRGYDITPWLPANMQRKYNYVAYKKPNAQPDFSFGEEDWRIRYDYDLTLSELFGKHFIEASRHWLEERGMVYRSQVYGMHLDMIGNAGKASIPETESQLDQEAILKVMSSGAHLYNRPITTSETLTFSQRGYMATPQKIKIAVDKLFTAGINQIIYHGVPYRYFTEQTTSAGWYPFYMQFINFSAHLGEGTAFWEYQKNINEYVTRVQYALRSGKNQADVLIYFPYMDVESMPENPLETLKRGYVEGVEPPLAKQQFASKGADKTAWAKQLYPIINQLDANGISWEWVNDESLQEAMLDGDKKINIRGNRYQSVMLVGTEVIHLQTAKRINELSRQGMNFVVVGQIPEKQPSFFNWQESDRLTYNYISEAVKQHNGRFYPSNADITDWIQQIDLPVRFTEQHPFLRQIQREMSDGSRAQFIWNMTDSWQTISLELDGKFRNTYWLEPEKGTIIPEENPGKASYTLPPHGSVILYASTKKRISSKILSKPIPEMTVTKEILKIETWNISVGSLSVSDSPLFDWRTNEQLRYSSEKGIYSASFTLNKIDKNTPYILDLGKVYFTAEVKINGRNAETRIFAPYYLDISEYLQKGENTIDITVTPTYLNAFIGKAEEGDALYKAFKGKDTMPAGLVGPVVIYQPVKQ